MRFWKWASAYGARRVFDVARLRFEGGEGSPLHRHDFSEVLWVEGGRGRHVLNGRVLDVRPGDLWFLRPWDMHAIESPPDGYIEIANVAVAPRIFPALVRQYPADCAPWLRWEERQAPACARMDADMRQRLAFAVEKLAGAPQTAMYAARFLFEVVGELAGQGEPRPLGGVDGVPEWMRLAISRMQHRPHLQEGLPAFARLAGVSPAHLARVARRALRRTPSQLINDWRVDAAARELRTTRRSIIAISYDLGLGNLSYFYRLFRARYQATPAEYRRRYVSN